MADSPELCIEATVDIFHYLCIYRFGWFCRYFGNVGACLVCQKSPHVGLGDQLWFLLACSECLTEGRKGPDAGFARKYMFLFSEQLGSWTIASKPNNLSASHPLFIDRSGCVLGTTEGQTDRVTFLLLLNPCFLCQCARRDWHLLSWVGIS